MNKILVLEDDEMIRSELFKLLKANGYDPVSEEPCDLVLLDVNLPGENGFSICRRIRTDSSVPIIFLTARSSMEDELLAFGVGADDFIRKPYNSAVLLARVSRLLRRPDGTVIEKEGLKLDLATLTLTYDGKRLELTKNETRILSCLMRKELAQKEEIIEELWSDSIYVDENTLYVNIARLRQKLDSLGMKDRIKSIRGVGYKL